MRVKRGVAAKKKHNKIRKATKGMQSARRSSVRLGKQAVVRSLQYAYRDRRNRKRTMRNLWITRINAGARINNTSYSELINRLDDANIAVDRKILAELAVSEPRAFEAIVKTSSKTSKK